MPRRWIYWLVIWLGGGLLGAAAGLLLRAQGATVLGNLILIATCTLVHTVIAGGVFAWAQRRWLLLTGIYLGLGLAAAALTIPLWLGGEAALGMIVLCGIALARLAMLARCFSGRTRLMLPAILLLWTVDVQAVAGLAMATNMPAITTVVVGTYAIVVAFWAGLWLIRAVLTGPWPIVGVARTLIDEAIRMKVTLIFIVLLVVMIPILPTFEDERLQYKLQTFLSWSFTIVSILLGLMTVFLSSATICNEIDRRQVFLTLTKPISRSHYLFGKWLGIGLLNLLLLTVIGIGVYTFARLIEISGDARDKADRTAVTWQLLTARQAIPPTPKREQYDKMIFARSREVRKGNQEGGNPQPLTPKQEEKIRQTVLTQWHSLSSANPQAFYFHRLHEARRLATAARAAREQRQLERLNALAAQSPDPQAAARFSQWAKAYLAAIEQRAESVRLRDLARSTTGPDTSQRLAEARKMQNESFERLTTVRRSAASKLGDLLLPGPREVIQLRFKPRASGDVLNERVALEIKVNGFLFPQGDSRYHTLADNNFHILNLPAENAVDGQGTMLLELANRSIGQQPEPDGRPRLVPISMTPGEGLEILYTAGTFEGNVVRCLVMIWIQLCFLAMFGLMAGTFLGFPVACVLCLLVFSAATIGGFLTESLRYYVSIPKTSVTFSEQAHVILKSFVTFLGDGKIWDAAKIVIGLVGKFFVMLIPPFHEYNPVPLVTDGRLIPYDRLGAAAVWVGFVATGACAVVACIIFRMRELARVVV